MFNLNEFRKVTGAELVFLLLFVSGAICPGMLAIWNFYPAFIEKCGAIMLVLLSTAMTLPVISINALSLIICASVTSNPKTDNYDFSDDAPTCIAGGACVLILTMGIPVLLAFMFTLSLKTFVWSVVGANLLFLGLCLWIGIAGQPEGNAEDKKAKS